MSRSVHRFFTACAQAPAMGAAFFMLFILGAIVLSTHSLFAFISIDGLVIVVGGVIAVAFMSFEAADVPAALGVTAKMFREPAKTQDTLHHDMIEIIAWAYMVKENGMRRLESSMEKSGIVDPFVKYGLTMVISGSHADDVRAAMESGAAACT